MKPTAGGTANHFTLSHQTVYVDVSLETRTLEGWTEIQIVPLSADISSASFHLLDSQVLDCEVEGRSADWQHTPFALRLNDATVRQHDQLRGRIASLDRSIDRCDLHIDFPDDVAAEREGDGFKTIAVKIWFRCVDPQHGFRFASDDLAYTSHDAAPCGNAAWLPCLDGMWEKCTWDVSVRTRADLKVVCAADPYEDKTDGLHKIHRFTQMNLTGAGHMGFCIGKFSTISLSEYRDAEQDEAMGGNAVDIAVHFFDDEARVRHTTLFLCRAIDTFVKQYGSYPYTSWSLVFLPDLPEQSYNLAGLSMVSERLLYDDRQIDPTYPTTRHLTYLLASQWMGVSTVPRTNADLWLTIGLAYHMVGGFLRKPFGVNDYRFRLKMAMSEIVREDVGRPGLSTENEIEAPVDPRQLSFIELKAPVVIHILERRMTRGGSSLGLQRVLPKILLQSMSGELANGLLTTAHFLRQCEKAAHVKLDDFARQWIYGHGYAKFSVVQRYNKKRMVVELGIRQQQFVEVARPALLEDRFVGDVRRAATREPVGVADVVFSGPMTIRIYETDGTAHEHVVDIKEQFTKVDVPFSTKSKRRRRGRGEAEEEEELEPQLGDTVKDEERFKIETWGAAEDDDTFEWIRIDANVEWICQMSLGQPEDMYGSQLQRDRDVVAQVEALEYFSQVKPTAIVSSVLFQTVMDSRYYFGIREMAARALVRCAAKEADGRGLFHLIEAYRARFCFDGADGCVPLENDWSDVGEYFVRRALLGALADAHQRTVLLDQLIHNDNSVNAFDDAYYLAHLIECLGTSLDHPETTKRELDSALEQIERQEALDGWAPSRAGLVPRACLRVRERLIAAGLLAVDYRCFLSATRENNNVEARVQGFRSLLLLGGLRQPSIVRYIIYTIRNDPSPYLQRELGLAIEAGFGATALRSKVLPRRRWADEEDAFVVEEDVEAALEQRRDRESRATMAGAIALLRAELGDGSQAGEELGKQLWQACNQVSVPPTTRRRLLDCCALLFDPKQRQVLKFKLPSMKARTVARRLPPTDPRAEGKSTRIVVAREFPLAKYQKQDRVKIRLKLV